MALIRHYQRQDAGALARLYNHYVTNTTITFDETPFSETAMAAKVEPSVSNGLPWLVIEKQHEIVGYACASAWKAKTAYRKTVETSVYVAPDFCGRGYGSELMAALISVLKNGDFHAAIAGITLPNDHSVALHEKFGMHKTAHFREVGFKFERWLDVGYWQVVFG